MSKSTAPWANEADKLTTYRASWRQPDDDDCWIWTGPSGEYGTFHWPSHGTGLVHRIAFQIEHGRMIANGLQIDHTCNSKLCVNPAHLSEVSQRENRRRDGERRSRCARGHSRDSYGYTKRGQRRCSRCDRDRGEPLGSWTYDGSKPNLPASAVRPAKPPIGPHPHDDVTCGLNDARMLDACGVSAKRTLHQARSRSSARIAAGSAEQPFPNAVDRIGSTQVYLVRDVREWHFRHSLGDNPSRPGWTEPEVGGQD